MATLEDMTSSSEVVLLDRPVLQLMATAMDGSWSPTDEPDPDRRATLLDAARLRLYANRQRNGWFLLTTSRARAGLDHGPGEWTIGFLATLDGFDDAPTTEEMAGQRSLFDHLDGDAGHDLAAAILTPAVTLVVTTDAHRYKHNREHDLPERLRVVELADAVAMLDLAPGEDPLIDLPSGLIGAETDRWWQPPC